MQTDDEGERSEEQGEAVVYSEQKLTHWMMKARKDALVNVARAEREGSEQGNSGVASTCGFT